MSEDWTISDLAARAAEVLRAGDAEAGSPDGRVRDLPSERVIRWYATTGLLDPPLSRRGRVARYGRRHLLQLVAIKRRQAAGHSLAAIQAELLGATDATLEAAARMPAPADDVLDLPEPPEPPDLPGLPDLPAPPTAVVPDGAATPPDRSGTAARSSSTRFWTRPPRAGATLEGRDTSKGEDTPEGGDTAAAGAVDPTTAAGSTPEDGETDHATAAGSALGFGAAPVPGSVAESRAAAVVVAATDSPAGSVGVPLAPGVTLLLDAASRRPTAADVTALASAAADLVAAARDRGLIGGGTGPSTREGAAS